MTICIAAIILSIASFIISVIAMIIGIKTLDDSIEHLEQIQGLVDELIELEEERE